MLNKLQLPIQWRRAIWKTKKNGTCHLCYAPTIDRQEDRNQFKIPNGVNGECETWMRRLNLETGEYHENWEHCPLEGFGR